jgi:hypothetical protein
MAASKIKLGDFAEVKPGVPFRSRIENEPEGTYLVIQPRDLRADAQIDLESAARVTRVPPAQGWFLELGDVVIQPRGTRFSVGQFGTADLPAVAAAPLLILRPDRSQVLPEFLAAVLMAPSTQAILRQSAVGTYVPQIPRHALESLAFELPDLPMQMRLVELARLGRRELELMDRLRDMRGHLFDLAVREAAKRSPRRANASGPSPVPASAPSPTGPLPN